MPARRPYASRGVPRPATTRRPGPVASATGLAALIVVLAAAALGGVWWGDLRPRDTEAPAPVAAPVIVPARAAAAATVPDRAPDSLQMANVTAPVSAPTPLTNAAGTPLPTSTAVPTLRRWDGQAPGVVTDPGLVTRLDQVLAGVDGHVSVAVKDLGSGRGAVLDGDRELPAASLYKLPILDSVFEAGLGMYEELPITEEARAFDSGSMELGVGETLSVAEALERMITISDNTAAVMLGSRVGGFRVNSTIAGLGMETTHYSLDRMTTSALDMLHFMDLVARGKAVSASASADMVHLLLRQRVNDRLPRLLPYDVQVAHKTGNLPGTVNDVGIVYAPSSTIAVAALISDTTDEAGAATAIARVGLAAYAYFEDQPENPNRPTLPRAPTRPIPPTWREPRPVPTATAVVEEEVVEPTPASTPSVARAATVAPTLGPTVVSATTAPTLKPTAGPAVATATPVPTLPPTATPVPAQPTRPPTPRPATPAPTQVGPPRR
jgi:beta-lactamase class A